MKKRIDVEALVRWAYREELPKAAPINPVMPSGFGFAWGGIAGYGKLLANVQEPDIRNRYGLAPDFTASREPHPDAIAVWLEIQALSEENLVLLPEDWFPFSDLGDLGHYGAAAAAAAYRKLFTRAPAAPTVAVQVSERSVRIADRPPAVAFLCRPLSEILQVAAILSPPDWRAEKPEIRRMTHANGTTRWFRREVISTETGSYETEVDGFDRKARRPYDDAYVKAYLDPDPVDAGQRRGEYQIWHAALGILAGRLAGRLDDHEPVPSERPYTPWETVEKPKARILVDPAPVPPIKRDPRPLAGPPPKRGIDKPKPEEGERPRRSPQGRADRIGGG